MNVLFACQEISVTSKLASHLLCGLCKPQLLRDFVMQELYKMQNPFRIT